MSKPEQFVGMNDVPDHSDFEGQELWVSIGDGHYRKFIGKDGRWFEADDSMYNQAEG